MTDWKDYEVYVVDRLRLELGEDEFAFGYKQMLYDPIAEKEREVDGLIIHKSSNQLIPIQTKFHARKTEPNEIEGFVTFCKNISSKTGVFVCTREFTKSAKNIADHYKIKLFVFSKEDFEKAKYLYCMSLYFLYFVDKEFIEDIRLSLVSLIEGDEEKANECLENVPYEEWLFAINTGLVKVPTQTLRWLKYIASTHYDDGWRFNSIQILLEQNELTDGEINMLLTGETDPETIELLKANLTDLWT